MRKVAQESRIQDIIQCATSVFCEKGYRQTQMADVAKAMGVAAGTLYLYVESKEALFDLVVRYGVETGAKKLPTKFPIRNPRPGATLAYLRKVLPDQGRWPKLKAASGATRAENPRSELTHILQELYSLMLRNRWGLILMTRSALDFPGLSDLFLNRLRKTLLNDLTRYIQSRVKAGQFRPLLEAHITAVFLNETIAWAVLHRMGDPEWRKFSDEQVNATVVEALVHSLVPLSETKSVETKR